MPAQPSEELGRGDCLGSQREISSQLLATALLL
jgi:hypothetical protein